MTREDIERLMPPIRPRGNKSRGQLLAGLEDYLFIGGDRMTLAQAAQRLGVADRTISRYRARLRQLESARTGKQAAWTKAAKGVR